MSTKTKSQPKAKTGVAINVCYSRNQGALEVRHEGGKDPEHACRLYLLDATPAALRIVEGGCGSVFQASFEGTLGESSATAIGEAVVEGVQIVLSQRMGLWEGRDASLPCFLVREPGKPYWDDSLKKVRSVEKLAIVGSSMFGLGVETE